MCDSEQVNYFKNFIFYVCVPSFSTWSSNFLNNRLTFCRTSAKLRYDQEFQDKTIIFFILTEKTKTRDKFSRIYKNETIITEILYCLALVQPYNYTNKSM